ncbi:rod shape-determining protein [Flavobacterium sp. GSB-24]|uniref:rod shape-determining protein n=1 Tax=Flavobacterium sp. GSB-24 TaxID=2994319 RepID=UPI0024917CEC|nr:rod shape-determining protein [Flavobacterium sp. GSB-24]BDU26926.1 rod shape-determining protein [Flavobacterium sp. GSB-24]
MWLSELMIREIAVDLGKSNTLIINEDEIVIDSPSIVARDLVKKKIIAVGRDAYLMQGKTHSNIKTIRPIKEGVIADFDAAEKMMGKFIGGIPALKLNFFPFSLRMLICMPLSISEIEIRAIREAGKKIGIKEVCLIYEPLAAAIGIGLDVMNPQGNMIVNIGSGTTEIAVICLGEIICSKSIKIAGDVFTEDILGYLKTEHQIQIGLVSAEKLKIEAGSAIDELEKNPEEVTVSGKKLANGIITNLKVGRREISKALDDSICRIEEAIIFTLSMVPPEIAADIYKRGLYLTGGGAFLRGLDRRIEMKTCLKVSIGEDPLRAAVKGANTVLKNKIKYSAMISSLR